MADYTRLVTIVPDVIVTSGVVPAVGQVPINYGITYDSQPIVIGQYSKGTTTVRGYSGVHSTTVTGSTVMGLNFSGALINNINAEIYWVAIGTVSTHTTDYKTIRVYGTDERVIIPRRESETNPGGFEHTFGYTFGNLPIGISQMYHTTADSNINGWASRATPTTTTSTAWNFNKSGVGFVTGEQSTIAWIGQENTSGNTAYYSVRTPANMSDAVHLGNFFTSGGVGKTTWTLPFTLSSAPHVFSGPTWSNGAWWTTVVDTSGTTAIVFDEVNHGGGIRGPNVETFGTIAIAEEEL